MSKLAKIPDGSWEQARPIIRRNMQLIESLAFGVNSNVIFNSVTVDTLSTSAINATSVNVSGLTASRLIATNADKDLVSVANLASWVAGTTNQVSIANDGDGTITLSTPQDIHTAALPQFTRLGLGVAANVSLLIHARETSKPVRVSSSAALTAGQYTGFEVQNTGIYTWGIGIDYDQGITSLVFKAGGMGTAGYVYKMTGSNFTNQGANPNWHILNTNNENTQDGCISVFNFKDHTDVVLSSISGAHDGVADDTKGVLILKTHNGTTLTERLRIDNVGLSTFSGAINATGNITGANLAISNWNTAYGWGNHAGLYDTIGTASGLIDTHESTYNHSNYNTAYGWGNHASAGYFIKASDDLDDISTGVTNVHLTSTLKTNYDAAYSHSQIAGGDSVHVSVTENSNWDAAYTHKSSNGSDHSYLNQNVTTTGTPTHATLLLNGADNQLVLAAGATKGLEIGTDGTNSTILSYNRGAATYTAFNFNGLSMLYSLSGTEAYSLSLTTNTATHRLWYRKDTTGITRVLVAEGAGQTTSEVFGIYANDLATARVTVNGGGAVDIVGDLTAGTIQADNGATGSFTTVDLKTVTVTKGIIVSIV